ncbi:MAG TPA: LON peptidase substrate-binding domain-containing protein [Acidimicrobiia bacterium]|jgi:Lon protease-like protein
MDPTPRRFPVFALGSVLFPHAVLPLQVFEERYLRMMDDVMAGDGSFGVVLIERGSEVGGGDHRFDVGTVAQVVRVGRLDESRLAVVAMGRARVRIIRWLPDEPYPQAEGVELPEIAPYGDHAALLEAARHRYRRTMALASEMGVDVGVADPDLPEDPTEAGWHLVDSAPVEQLDRQRLLEESDPVVRLHMLLRLLDDRATLLEARLGGV